MSGRMIRRGLFFLWCTVIVLLWTIALTGCLTFGDSGETTTDRLKEQCAESGGEWTQFGCEKTLEFEAPDAFVGIPADAPSTVRHLPSVVRVDGDRSKRLWKQEA